MLTVCKCESNPIPITVRKYFISQEAYVSPIAGWVWSKMKHYYIRRFTSEHTNRCADCISNVVVRHVMLFNMVSKLKIHSFNDEELNG